MSRKEKFNELFKQMCDDSKIEFSVKTQGFYWESLRDVPIERLTVAFINAPIEHAGTDLPTPEQIRLMASAEPFEPKRSTKTKLKRTRKAKK